METIDQCSCGLRRANHVCPKCDELVWDLIEEELHERNKTDEQ
jgi:hypothetical protein